MTAGLVATPPPAPANSARLWRPLAHPFRRTAPPRGFDTLGEKFAGAAARRRAGRLDHPRAARILAQAAEFRNHSDGALADLIDDARAAAAVERDRRRVADTVFSLGCEVIRRHMGFTLHVEQVLGALAMSEGCCAELATGEGKTVTAILPAALDGWSGRGVHVITVNDYLARRDAEITGPCYRKLGLSIGVIQDSLSPDERREAYSKDITYAADKQVIFDHLRDRLASPLSPTLPRLLLDEMCGPAETPSPEGVWSARVVQRGLYAAIVDEADSVLIDEAVTPAIIGASDPSRGRDRDEAAAHFAVAAEIARSLEPTLDYAADRRIRYVRLTPARREKLATLAASLPAFWAGPRRREELVVTALTAKELYTRGDDYIVKDGEVVIVDRSTGRILPGRQWQMGIHQAVEAKEGLDTTPERRTTSRVSYQQFFQRYERLCGMTGTATEVADELWSAYRLPVVRIPTHKPVIRTRPPDRFFETESAKFEAVADRVTELHAAGRPVLIGTRSVLSSERLAQMLAQRNMACNVLNATREAEEAAIVAQAGEKGAITVATNMAGRGTDIKLGTGVRELGGLVVIATERHDEARVDRQLFGRAGRQGDPGAAEVFASLDDQLIAGHGITPLLKAFRGSRGTLRRVLGFFLWKQAQWGASRRHRASRAQVANAESWMDAAFHHQGR